MLDLRGSKPGWLPGAVILLALIGCGGASSEGDRQGPASPPGQIVPVGEGDKNPAASAAPETPPPSETALSRRDYIAGADELCGRYLPQIRALENPAEAAARKGDFSAAADLFERAISESESEVAALRDLPVPEGSGAILNRIYAGVEESNRLFRSSLEKLRSAEVAAFNTIGEKARSASVRSKGLAASFGFEVCGQSD